MKFEERQKEGWRVIELEGRIDSFNQQDVAASLQAVFAESLTPTCIELSKVDFLSLPTIRFFNESAREFYDRGIEFSIAGGNDKTRRHIEIYGDLKYIRLVKAFDDLLGRSRGVERSA